MGALPTSVMSRLAAKAAPLVAGGSRSLQRQRLAGEAAPDTLRAVVLMCDFSDSLLYGRYGQVPGDFPPPRQSDFYYAAHDSLYFHFQMEDVASYFTAASGGRFTLMWDVVGTVADLPRPMSDYGNDPRKGEQPAVLAADVVARLDPVVDFGRYDTVVIIHAGAGEETDVLNNSPEQIYSTYLGPEDFARAAADSVLPQPYIPTSDVDAAGHAVQVTNVLVLPETEFQDPVPPGYSGYAGSLGVYCFEFGLRLGMLSLSDFTPAGQPDSQGVGEFDLMGYGLFVGAGYIPCQPSVFNKMLMGWINPYRVEPDAGGVFGLRPIETASGGGAPADSLAARIEIGGREYWLLEYRQEDPDGNRIFSFSGDLNHNNIPDFYDADSANGDGTPTGLFDPATDRRESLTGAEWDFFMSENGAMPAGVHGGRGSGIYIWHVDEGVIEDVIGMPENLFNADPKHKSVDLEEADGIQDLDSRQQSAWMLGGDFDSFRGENNATFGPETNPDTRSAGGAWTGVLIDRISKVVADSSVIAGVPPDTARVVKFADRMTFRCSRVQQGGGGAALIADRELDGVDLTGSHPLAVDLHAPADGRLEVVAGGARGEVYAFEPDLSEFRDGDQDPSTIGVLALGTDATGAPARWNGPAAAGDIDGDGRQEIVLTAPHGLYAFNGEDGSEVADGDGIPASRGVLTTLRGCTVPPVLLRLDGQVEYSPGAAGLVALIEAGGEGLPSRLRFLDGAGHDVFDAVDLGSGTAQSPPLPVSADLLAVAVGDTVSGFSTLLLVRRPAGVVEPAILASLPLSVAPGPLPLAAVRGEGLSGVIVTGNHGEAETVWWDGALTFSHRDAWPARAPVLSPLAGGEAFSGGGLFARATASGHPAAGWPVRPFPAADVASLPTTPSPLIASATAALGAQAGAISGAAVLPAAGTLFQSRDGRLYLYDGAGRLASGWPVAGPSATAGTPIWDRLDEAGPKLLAVGTFPRIVGRDADTGTLATRPVARLMVWSSPAFAYSRFDWPMWQQNPWRAPAARSEGVAAGSGLLVGGSHFCYPSPLGSGPLHVRAVFNARCTARAYLYNLAGELVASSPPSVVPGPGPFEIELAVEKIASGMYLCRLVADGSGGGSETSVVSVAVAR